MKLGSFFKFLINPNSGYSSKRFAALVLLMFGILIPVVCMFLDPIGEIHDSILLLALQLLASGCGLLGFTLKEKFITKPHVILPTVTKDDEVKENVSPTEDESDIGPDMTESYDDYPKSVRRRRSSDNYTNNNLG